MYYSIVRKNHDKYGCIISIENSMNGLVPDPFQAVRQACQERRKWLEEGAAKVRLLINDQIMTPKKAEVWATEEYKTLPKCHDCYSILNENLFTHNLTNCFFCSQACADAHYNEQIEKCKNEEDIDYL